MNLENKVAVVTGSGRGIGRAIAEQLCASGARVVIAEYADYGEQAAKEINEKGGQAAFIKVDVSSRDSVQTMIDGAREAFGSVDILVNNAGYRPTRAFLEMSNQEWEQVIAVNLTGAFYCCKAAAPLMIDKKWGRIINISSLAAQQGSTSGHSHYSAAKSGIVGLSKSLARELAGYGITVNVISPGWIDTEGWGGQLDGRRDEFAARVPLGRLGQPADVASLAAFLASEEAGYITGTTIPVNGGLYIS